MSPTGPAEGFSLPAGDNLHFIVLSPASETYAAEVDRDWTAQDLRRFT